MRVGTVIFFDDFSSGGLKNTPDQHWDPNIDNVDGLLNRHGTQIDFVPNPTSPDKKVMRITVTGIPAKDLYPGGNYWRTGYPSWVNEKRVSVTAVETKVFIPSDWSGDGISLFSSHGLNGELEVTGMEISISKRITLVTRTVDGKEIRNKTSWSIPTDKWVTLRMEFTDDITIFIVDSQVVEERLFRFVAKDAHAGLLRSSPTMNDGLVQGKWILNTDFKVEVQ